MNPERVFETIELAATRAGRDPGSIVLCAVSKKQTIEKMQAYIDYCTAHNRKIVFGENYLQEYKEKRSHIAEGVEVHCIGHLQSNKAKEAAMLFNCVESVDSLSLATKLNAASAVQGSVLPVFVQVNISRDAAKSGVLADDAEHICTEIMEMPHLKLRGLMTITELYANPEDARADFAKMRVLRDSLVNKLGVQPLELSMGMSDDFMYAIEEGADIVRVGSALFGARS